MRIVFTERTVLESAVPTLFYLPAAGRVFAAAWETTVPALAALAGSPERKQPAKALWLDEGAVVMSAAGAKYLAPGEAWRTILGEFLKLAAERSVSRACVVVDALSDSALRRDALRGLLLAAYRFQRYRNEPDVALEALELRMVVAPGSLASWQGLLAEESILADSVNLARDLVNEPGNRLYPEVLVEAARNVAAECGLEIEVLDEQGLAAAGYEGILAVGKGSLYPPRLVILRHAPAGAAGPPLALIGKGITFDTGGISLKPGKDMHEMKGDMAGAAAVLGAIRAIALSGHAGRVVALLPTAENMVGRHAQRPGDIFRHRCGKYVQVDNTDAEGRLVLIDALYQAGLEGASPIVDIATLTGACLRALGESVAGVLGNDPLLVREVIDAGARNGEMFCALPLVEEYRKDLDTPLADIRNLGGPYAGAITAALFLREFVPEGASWAHLDIAGVFYAEKGWKYYTPGATGFGVQTLVDWVRRKAAGA